jgi:hypothetical protein
MSIELPRLAEVDMEGETVRLDATAGRDVK